MTFKIGDKKGELTILEKLNVTSPSGIKRIKYRCKCTCGTEITINESTLIKRDRCNRCSKSLALWKYHRARTNMDHVAVKHRVYRRYHRTSVDRGFEFELSMDDFLNLVSQNCVYCGAEPIVYPGDIKDFSKHEDEWKRNGIDRIDASRGYTLDNCVPCCWKCNCAKNTQSLDEFKDLITRIYNHLIIGSSTTILNGSTSEANADGNGEHPCKDDDIV